MYFTHFWNKFDIHRCKIGLIILLFCLCFGLKAQQRSKRINLPNYDLSNIHYGFMLGGMSSKYRITYNEDFTTPRFDSLHSVVPGNLGGFKLSLVVNILLYQYLDVRILPTFAFYQNNLTYRFTDGTSITELRDPTYVELPLLLKYKSVRRSNARMYLLGGITPSIRAAGKGTDDEERLLIRSTNISFELGAGFDLYQQLFKFSPEIRYSFSLVNVLEKEKNSFSAALDRISTHNLTFYITFEGGPSELKQVKRKNAGF